MVISWRFTASAHEPLALHRLSVGMLGGIIAELLAIINALILGIERSFPIVKYNCKASASPIACFTIAPNINQFRIDTNTR